MTKFRSHPISKCAKRVLATAVVAIFATTSLCAQSGPSAPDVTTMSVEDLMNLQVTSVSKRSQRIADAAAAVFAITQEDIRRSGARNIPEVLRMVPGLQVARIDENKWAIGSRGFNGRFDDKLLVLIDGRSVYTPLFSGVYWNVQDVMLENVDRIEVIRGPGATLWGANAVNGVINIITKTAKDTQGSLLSADAGNGQLGAGLRYGGSLGSGGYYRLYSKYTDSEDIRSGQFTLDGMRSLHSGMRADFSLSSKDSLTVEGDLFHAGSGEAVDVFQLTPPYQNVVRTTSHADGGDLMLNWSEIQSDRSRTQLRVSVDHDQ